MVISPSPTLAPVPTATNIDDPSERVARLGAAAWVGVVGVGLVWGTLAVKDAGVSLGAAPLFGHWDWRLDMGLLPATALGVATVTGGPVVARRAQWRLLPGLTAAWGVAWAVALAAADGWDRLTAPLTSRHEYEPLAARVDDLGVFFDTYVDRLGSYPIHVQGHPPGAVVIAWLLDRVGLAGAGWLGALVIASWGGTLALALVTQRRAAGEAAARHAAPALAVLPAAIWAATSMDAVFAAVVACAVALAVAAGTSGRRELAALAGFAGGLALLGSYGAAAPLLVGVVAVVVVAHHPQRLLVPAAAGALVPLALAAAAGFWWPAGLLASGRAYWAGVASDRPALYLLVAGNPAAFALAAGPAVAAGLALAFRARRCAAAVLPLAALGVVALVDLSQMSRGEVERIWLPFVPWLALAAPGDSRAWIGAQVGVALLLQSTLVSAW